MTDAEFYAAVLALIGDPPSARACEAVRLEIETRAAPLRGPGDEPEAVSFGAPSPTAASLIGAAFDTAIDGGMTLVQALKAARLALENFTPMLGAFE